MALLSLSPSTSVKPSAAHVMKLRQYSRRMITTTASSQDRSIDDDATVAKVAHPSTSIADDASTSRVAVSIGVFHE